MRDIITVDLDSTLCDTRHRHGLIDRINGTDWAAYSKACVNDAPVEATVLLVKRLHTEHTAIHFLSGRDACAREETLDWLYKHALPVDGLWMDEGGDHVTEFGGHAQYKLARIKEIEAVTGLNVVLHIDDWVGVRNHLAENGIPCICVRAPHEWDLPLGDHL